MSDPQSSALLTHDWTTGYPMTLRSVRLARLHVRRRLTMWNWPGDIEDAVLVTSELVANAVVHGRIPGHELRLRLLELDDGVLSIEVSDPALVFPAVRPRDLSERGRGLIVVRQLADSLDWFLRAGVGKTVRARLGAPKG
ncbi:ATP-binding protein [Streptomyces graminilatus]|uniref:ATP-binding protein n=1 Tax=Streptomyces graminilatus TaxID=1464070 RepID=UPI000B2024BE|nr:ATP-binding protein [Streptomyces graminilatus]